MQEAEGRAVVTTDVRTTGFALLAGGALVASSGAHSPLACPLRTLTGVPCPLCGMTTSVDATFHAHLGPALAANPAGVAAVASAVAVQFGRVPAFATRRVVLFPVLVGMWLFELHRFGVV